YIRKERQKTKVEFIVPLHTIAEAIISHCRKEQERSEEQQTVKEKDDHLVFHRNCSRSVMDTKLSIVGKACGIRQRLSFHMARHTFGTMSLSAGIPIESIAKMMGHASISSTQVYAQVTDNKISEDMDRLIAKQSAKEKETSEREEMKMQSTIGYEMCNHWCFVNRYRIFVSKKFFILYIPISCL
ncbi:tyrosine-type recombinase/integrase, partial [Hoylesella buccalis]|uniref:tyrosine-type recombinase/integrase n=1 Tax=Hoylesella buccalis TaxID=28127 RepID=UPI0026EA5904